MTERVDPDALEAVIEDGVRRGLSSAAIAACVRALFEDPTWAKAMGHPMRGKILRLFRERGELSPRRATAELGDASLPAISYHFRQLAGLGLIEECDRIPRRGAIEHVYRLCDLSGRAGAGRSRAPGTVA